MFSIEIFNVSSDIGRYFLLQEQEMHEAAETILEEESTEKNHSEAKEEAGQTADGGERSAEKEGEEKISGHSGHTYNTPSYGMRLS